MTKFIIGTFAILGWAFLVLSGGSDFVPEERVAAAEPAPVQLIESDGIDIVVARADTASLGQLTDTPATPEPAQTASPPQQPVQTVVTASPTTTAAVTAPQTPGSSTDIVTTEQTQFASLSGADNASLGVNPIREVSARAVNMRDGPGTDFNVIDTLTQGTQAEIMATDGAGWVRVYIPGTGMTGWMAERLLTEG